MRGVTPELGQLCSTLDAQRAGFLKKLSGLSDTDARRSSEQAKFVATANSLDARKVTVDPLGRIRWAND